jgi:hypothetical protein
VGPYRREQLHNRVTTVSDGGIVAESRFRLLHAHLDQEASDGKPHCTTKSESLDEHWSLRVIHVAEFMEVAQEAGLEVLAKYSTFQEGIDALDTSVKGGQAKARVVKNDGPCVFVLGVGVER